MGIERTSEVIRYELIELFQSNNIDNIINANQLIKVYISDLASELPSQGGGKRRKKSKKKKSKRKQRKRSKSKRKSKTRRRR